jgi:hypothetical protein
MCSDDARRRVAFQDAEELLDFAHMVRVVTIDRGRSREFRGYIREPLQRFLAKEAIFDVSADGCLLSFSEFICQQATELVQ